MIEVEILRDKAGYRSLSARNHSGYDVSGRDIVCAAASALLINTLNAIEQLTDDPFTEEENEEDAILKFHFKGETVSDQSTLLMDALILGLESLEKEYPGYLSLTVKEIEHIQKEV